MRFTTVAYSPRGDALWTNVYSGPADWDEPLLIVADEKDNVYVAGSSDGTGGQSDSAVVAYSPAGSGLWTNRFGDTAGGYGTAYPAAMGTSPDRVYLAGDF
jgi:hypothetical protein